MNFIEKIYLKDRKRVNIYFRKILIGYYMLRVTTQFKRIKNILYQPYMLYVVSFYIYKNIKTIQVCITKLKLDI